MIFNHNSWNYILFLVLVLWIWTVVRLFRKHIIYQNIGSDHRARFGEEETLDDITRARLAHNWDKPSYNRYYEDALASMERARNERIVFVGLCQDNGARALGMWMPLLQKLGGHFQDYHILMVENDSVDNTREVLLRETQRNKKLTLLCDSDKPINTKTCQLGARSVAKGADKEKNLENRVRTLARFRQVYWDYVKEHYHDYDYMCVVDWDLEGTLSVSGFFHGLFYTKDITDVVACNSFYQQGGNYWIYDTYPMLNHYRCDYLKRNKRQEDDHTKSRMGSRLLSGHPLLVPVESAFGGIALYHIQNAIQKHAQYTNPLCPIECEHTTFHQNLTVHIDPWMTFYITRNNH